MKKGERKVRLNFGLGVYKFVNIVPIGKEMCFVDPDIGTLIFRWVDRSSKNLKLTLDRIEKI